MRLAPLLLLVLMACPGLAPAATAPAPAATAWSPTLTTSAAWHDNVTNSDRPGDILPALQTLAAATLSHRHLLGRDDSLLLGARLLAEAWPRYDGLDRTALGTSLLWQHKFALGPYAPTLRAELTGDLLLAREPGRSGQTGTAALVYRQRFASLLRVQLGHEWARTDTRDLAFDRTGRETSAQLSAPVGRHWDLALTLRHRYGTVLAYSRPPRADLIAKGKRITFASTFERDQPMIAYYFDARTHSLELRATRTFGPRLALTIAAEFRDTTHGPESYQNRTATVALVRSF